MARKLLSVDEFSKQAKLGSVADLTLRLAGGDVIAQDDEARTITYRFSDETVARDRNTIRTAGWDIEAYNQNPVFLWAHDDEALPIGKVIDITISNGVMSGEVEYASRDLYPFADTVYQMARQRFLNAVSVRWLPQEWKFTNDKSRPGGIDFLRQELLEVSQVPVPALSTALATARKAGIDTQPFYEWAEKVLDNGGMIMVPRRELEQLRSAAKMPAATRKKPKEQEQPRTKRKFKRGLYEVANLAYLLMQLGWLKQDVEMEAVYEEDGSLIPERLAAILKELGQALVDMTAEEVAELVDDSEDDEIAVMQASIGAWDHNALIALANVIEEREARAGKKLSSATRENLERACGMISDGHAAIRSMIEEDEGDEERAAEVEAEPQPDVLAIARARRERQVRALKLKISLKE